MWQQNFRSCSSSVLCGPVSTVLRNKLDSLALLFTDCLQHNVYENEMYNQERRSTLDQDELEPLQVKQEKEEPEEKQKKEEQQDLEHQIIKVEEKEVYSSQGEEQIELEQETDTCMVVPAYEQTNQTESEPNKKQVIFQEAAEVEKQNQKRRKPFSCVTCEKCFAFKCSLEAHMRIHTESLSESEAVLSSEGPALAWSLP